MISILPHKNRNNSFKHYDPVYSMPNPFNELLPYAARMQSQRKAKIPGAQQTRISRIKFFSTTINTTYKPLQQAHSRKALSSRRRHAHSLHSINIKSTREHRPLPCVSGVATLKLAYAHGHVRVQKWPAADEFARELNLDYTLR